MTFTKGLGHNNTFSTKGLTINSDLCTQVHALNFYECSVDLVGYMEK